eukprot:1069886-Amphidinium_carterae.1
MMQKTSLEKLPLHSHIVHCVAESLLRLLGSKPSARIASFRFGVWLVLDWRANLDLLKPMTNRGKQMPRDVGGRNIQETANKTNDDKRTHLHPGFAVPDLHFHVRSCAGFRHDL